VKRIAVLLLALLLLCGCASDPAAPETPAETETAPAETSGPELFGVDALDAESVLLYRQEDFDARLGSLMPVREILSAPSESLMPRTHIYDELFSGDAALWLQLLDYALANGWQAFSVPDGTLPELRPEQRKALELMYSIDHGKVLSFSRDGFTTVWYQCRSGDTMEKFSLGLAAARQIAADAPQGDEWETVRWIFTYLADHVVYGERDTYYRLRGHQLYDALVEEDTVCTGYADAMYYLCSLCGVECLVVNGLVNSREKAGGLDDHAWNRARIDGNWYVFDPTYNATAQAGTTVFFALSSEVMRNLGGHRPNSIYPHEELYPACERCFDPVSAWNGTPEGAVRSWLWYASAIRMDPSYLLFYEGLVTYDTPVTPSEDGMQATLDVPYADHAAWSGRFMSQEAASLFPFLYSASEEGKLIIRASEQDSGTDWAKLKLVSLSEADGVYTADLGTVSVALTLSLTDEGLYRVETAELLP
jgi:hypothetical protein